jgi:hypothetical protein
MAWTYDQRMQRARDLLVDSAVLAESSIETIKRPPFFGKYRFGVGLSATPESWHEFDHNRAEVQAALHSRDCFVQSNSKTFDLYIFSNNPKVLRWIARNHRNWFVNHLRMVDRGFWHRTLPRPKPKGKFFNQFTWRIRLSRWQMEMRPVATASGVMDCPFPGLTHHAIAAIKGPHKVLRQGRQLQRTFLYVDTISDVLMLKLILGGDITEIEERS